ncbi:MULTISPECIES: very short patch repair endonuclease [unclassified Bradyrhizobium]|uniref:very short patch repair endonuclease n=1 Tax=unclassified Bradyrhizobium TaxID=2631580 RepID=UPI002916C955|nr:MULTISPECIES: very short patch repair endonuclease [unclassified Bradyrhizobium]
MDKLSAAERSALMSRVRGRDTSPERIVRRALTDLGIRYQLNSKDVLGKPDIVFKGRRRVIFVHGCFWHQHPKCRRAKRPATRSEFWSQKLDDNIRRDRRIVRTLRAEGWSVLILWECQLRDPERLKRKLNAFLAP